MASPAVTPTSPGGASGVSRVSLYFQGGSETTSLTRSLTGPIAEDWVATQNVGPESLVFGPCGEDRYLNINTELRVSAGSSASVSGFVARDAVSSYRLLWRRCPGG
ncbi:DUF4360 domain-containing protein [Plantactinospora sp. CA-290183]|uniref:DUF4360 domain-containing protein n=1 Tax=Plantactinospora sp. CA-290183 TaxID=3240006 RepID=UPI003D930AF0